MCEALLSDFKLYANKLNCGNCVEGHIKLGEVYFKLCYTEYLTITDPVMSAHRGLPHRIVIIVVLTMTARG